MKKKISKLWGIGLVVMLLGGLFVVAAPVSAADPLTWNNEYPPSTVFNILAPGLDIYDMDINGDTVWAGGVGLDSTGATDNCVLYKSVDGGKTWVLNNDGTTWLGLNHPMFQCDFIAIAPDDPNIVVVVDNDPIAAYVSTTGGAMWSDLYIENANTVMGDGDITDLTISPSVFGTHYVTVSGEEDITGDAAILFFNLGAASPSWVNAVDEGAFAQPGHSLTDDADAFYAIEYSPNFASDYILVAVSSNDTAGVQLHVASFNSWKWNEAIGYFENYPATVAINTAAPNVVTVSAADLVLAPDYMGGDDVLRVAFVGLDAVDNAVDISGIYRMSNTISKGIMAAPAGINSVGYNGSVLVAGAYRTNITYYCADPLAITPTVLPARTYKRPGVDSVAPSVAEDAVIVKWYGENVLAGKRGDASAISISRDNGLTWNDISLMDSELTDINDIYVSPDGSTWYVTANDSGEASLYRFSGGWERVLCDSANQAFMLRAAVDDANAIYVAQPNATDIYFSADGGMTRWYKRSAPGDVVDLAVESKDVIYVGIGSTIRKSANQGFTWGPSMYPATGGNVNNIKALSENNVVVGTDGGFVGYTTDGGATWTKIPVPTGAAGAIWVTATGLESGGAIFAGSATDDEVTRWVIGTDVTWRDMLPPENATYVGTGIELSEGVLYFATANGTIYRQTWPTITNPSAIFWNAGIAAAGKVFDKTPNAIKVSSGSTKLWAISSGTGAGLADEVMSYVDTLAGEAPGLVAPADAALIPLNIQSGTNYAITFTWTRPSLATDYSLYIGLDAFMTQYHSASVFYNPTDGGTHGPYGSSMPTLSYVISAEFTPGTTYYWAVAAAAPIPGKMSEIRSFTVQPGVAAVPTIGSPANGADNIGVNPAFSWSPVTGATKYEFQLAVSTNFATPLYSEQLAETGIRPAVALVPGTTYFWRVRAIEPVMGDWSTIANFTVAAEKEPAPPPVEIVQTPPPVIEIPPAPPAQEIVIPPAPAPEEIAPSYIWAIIIIGAILVIAVIVLIVRTRRQV